VDGASQREKGASRTAPRGNTRRSESAPSGRRRPNDLGRVRLAGWEVRNLRMAANIRQAAAGAPGGRVLVIVGSGHKPWLEAYLGMMADVRIADALAVLR